LIIGDASYDAEDIRSYNAKRGIKSIIPVNPRNLISKKRGRPKKFDEEVYKKRDAAERFNGWIEAYKKVKVRYKKLEASYFGPILLASALMIWRVLE
jgi:transposase